MNCFNWNKKGEDNSLFPKLHYEKENPSPLVPSEGSVRVYRRRSDSSRNSSRKPDSGEPSSSTSHEKSSPQVKLPIAGVKVEFPFEPYSVQKYMMCQVLGAIKKCQNCLLESPTGTGKTLGLLCSTLGWQKQERETLEELARELKNPTTSATSKNSEDKGKEVTVPFEAKSCTLSPDDDSSDEKYEQKCTLSPDDDSSDEEYERKCTLSPDDDSSDEEYEQTAKRKKESLGSSVNISGSILDESIAEGNENTKSCCLSPDDDSSDEDIFQEPKQKKVSLSSSVNLIGRNFDESIAEGNRNIEYEEQIKINNRASSLDQESKSDVSDPIDTK